MPSPIFIGDEVSASAYRLGGARVRIPSPDQVASDLEWASGEAQLVLITAEFAEHVPPKQLASAQSREQPLVLVVPGVGAATPLPDLSQWIRAQLGLEA